MTEPVDRNESAPPTVRIGWGALVVIVAGAATWWIGVGLLDDLLAIDTQCEDRRHYGRGAELAEIARCSIEAGFGGWLYVAWLAIFPLALMAWLERALRKAVLARKGSHDQR